jgi:MFS family permease
MITKNRKLLITTLTAFLIYFTQGFFGVLSGALTPLLSGHYGASLSAIGFLFTVTAVARVFGNYFSGKILPRVRLHRFVVATTLVVVAMLMLVFSVDNIWVFFACISVCSFALGAQYSLANHLILRLYGGKKRAAVMSLMTSFYSIGALLSPFIFSSLLKVNVSWSWIFLITAAADVTMLLCLGSDRNVLAAEHGPVLQPKLALDRHILLSTLSISLYTIAETTFSLWLSVLVADKLHLSLADAAFSLVLLWSGLAAGRIVIGFIARRFPCHKIIFALSLLIILAIVLLFTAMTPANYQFIILLLGLGLSAMFSMILAFGNEQSEKPDSRLMNLLTTAGSVGTLGGMFASSLLKAFVSAGAIFLFAFGAMMIAVLCVMASLLMKKKAAARAGKKIC